jgi:hypothetical protein
MSESRVIRPERPSHMSEREFPGSLLVRRGFRNSYRVTARCGRRDATDGQHFGWATIHSLVHVGVCVLPNVTVSHYGLGWAPPLLNLGDFQRSLSGI